jgi:folylpolyglutamate synthase
VSIRERIKLNGEAISEELFTKYFWVCWDALELALRAHPSLSLPGWFKYLTIMAYKVFQEEKVDCAVIEVGIGGRTDATNVLPTPVRSLVTITKVRYPLNANTNTCAYDDEPGMLWNYSLGLRSR